MKIFSGNLKELRTINNLSQENLAKKMNITRSLISQWERSLCEPNIDAIKKLCAIFKVSSDYLLGIEEF